MACRKTGDEKRSGATYSSRSSPEAARASAARLVAASCWALTSAARAGHRALERLDLVLHERDERRDDEREVVAQQRGELVAERLAGAGGHDHEQVAVSQRGVDRLGLAGPEGAEAEVLAQSGEGAIHGGDDHSAALGRHRPLTQSRDVWRGAAAREADRCAVCAASLRGSRASARLVPITTWAPWGEPSGAPKRRRDSGGRPPIPAGLPGGAPPDAFCAKEQCAHARG